MTITIREFIYAMLDEEYDRNIRHGQDKEEAMGNAAHDVEMEVSVILDDWQEGKI